MMQFAKAGILNLVGSDPNISRQGLYDGLLRIQTVFIYVKLMHFTVCASLEFLIPGTPVT